MNMQAPPTTPAARDGFTLIEMSIVLVVIGLLFGGIIAGQYMIRQTGMQAIISDLTKYKSAYMQFKTQYTGLPGDLLDATDYWGTDPDGCPTHTNRVGKKETCNGGGDGFIGYGATGAATAQPNESFRAWQQLADAGLVGGTYTGVAGSGGTTDNVPTQNVPAGKLSRSTVGIFSPGYYSTSDFYPAYYGTTLIYGATISNNYPYGTLLTPSEAYAMDQKMDDGLPAAGSVLSMKSTFNASCTTTDTAASAAYNMPDKAPDCALLNIIDSY